MKTVMNLSVCVNCASWVVEERLDFEEGLCSLELSLRNIQTVDCSEDSEGSEWNVGRDVR